MQDLEKNENIVYLNKMTTINSTNYTNYFVLKENDNLYYDVNATKKVIGIYFKDTITSSDKNNITEIDFNNVDITQINDNNYDLQTTLDYIDTEKFWL